MLKQGIDRFNLSYDQSVWDFVDDLRSVRNRIVHASGDVSRRKNNDKANLQAIAKKNIGIHIGSESTQ